MNRNITYTDEELCEMLMNSDSESEMEQLEGDDSDSDKENQKDDEGDEDDEINVANNSPPKKKLKTSYVWVKDNKQPLQFHNFYNSNVPKPVVKDDCNTILDCFEQFFSPNIIERIVEETNNFYKFSFNFSSFQTKSRITKWKDTDSNEIFCFLAVNLLMPHIKKQRMSDYWTMDTFISTPIFGQIMSRDRFMLILRMLHFSDSENVDKTNPLFKIQSVVDLLKQNFRQILSPAQNLCIDKSLMLFKGRLASKQNHFGIKLFVLCDCASGYILDFIIYTGSKAIDGNLGKSGNIVYTLMKPYLDKGHTLFVDKWYSSPELFTFLHDRKTNACGTVRKNRRNLPTMNEKLEKGEIVTFKSENVMALQWMDRKDVTMLSTYHTDEIVGTGKKNRFGEDIEKPTCLLDYSNNMGTVNKTDMLLSSTESVRKSIKWYKKLFFHLLDMSKINAHALYNTLTPKKITLLDFQLELVKQIIAKYKKTTPRASSSKKPASSHSCLRLIERHFPSMYTASEEGKKAPSRRCVVCAIDDKRRETRYTCEKCDVPLCVVPCFEMYHTQ